MTIEEMRAAFLALAEASEIKHRKEHHKAARDFEAVAESWRQTAEICSRLDRIAEELEKLRIKGWFVGIDPAAHETKKA